MGWRQAVCRLNLRIGRQLSSLAEKKEHTYPVGPQVVEDLMHTGNTSRTQIDQVRHVEACHEILMLGTLRQRVEKISHSAWARTST